MKSPTTNTNKGNKYHNKMCSFIMASSPDGIASVDENLTITYANESMCIITEMTLDEMIGKNLSEIVTPVGHQEDGPKQLSPSNIASHQILDVIIKTRKESGERVELRYIREEDSSGIGSIILTRNGDQTITAKEINFYEQNLRDGEVGFQQLFDFTVEAYFLSRKGYCIGANKTACKIFGYTPEEFIGIFGTDVIAPESRDLVKHNMLNNIKSPYEGVGLRKDGSTFPVEIQGQVITYKGESVRLTAVKDISARKKDQLEKEEMQRKVFMSAKLASLGELSAGVGHEINNPLMIIHGNLELIERNLNKKKLLSPDIKKCLDGQQVAVRRISGIVNGLRTFARTDSDIVETLDIQTCVETTLSFIQVIYEKEGMIVNKNFPKHRVFIDGSIGRFQQVLINLLSNAKDATEKNPDRKISINLSSFDKIAQITIQDNGQGISEENLPKIFDSFFTTKPIGKGTGLGLGIVKNIIENIGGSIQIESSIGKGTAVYISIPTSLKHHNEQAKTKKQANRKALLKGTVLIVDDEEEIRVILSKCLIDFGLSVDIVKNGAEALELINTKHYDYIITDLTMPIMRGEELIDKIKANPNCKAKIFVATGVVSKDSMDLAVDGVINKPFGKNDIYNQLKKFQ